jgi:D-alanine-D-alanine ligase
MLRSSQERWIQTALAEFRENASKHAIFIVASLKSETGVMDDYEGFSVQNDYLHERVLHDIGGALQREGAYVRYFNGEDAFIRAYHRGEIDKVQRPHKLVFNLAQSGTGPARKSLIPCFCNLHHIPYCNSNGEVVALLRHKYHVSSILRDHGFPVPSSWYFLENGEWLQSKKPEVGRKVIIKAIYESACIGLAPECVRVVDSSLDLFAKEHARRLRQPLIIQEFIPGFEVDVPVFSAPAPYAPAAIGVSIDQERDLGERFLHFQNLASGDFGFYDFGEVDSELALRLRTIAQETAVTLDLTGYGRIDFRVDTSGRPYIIDLQTLPDIFPHSSVHASLTTGIVEAADVYSTLVAINCKRLGLL